jgi:hypothetical protein
MNMVAPTSPSLQAGQLASGHLSHVACSCYARPCRLLGGCPLRKGFSIQHSAFSIQHSAFSIQHSAFSIQHSAFSIGALCRVQPCVKQMENRLPWATGGSREEGSTDLLLQICIGGN